MMPRSRTAAANLAAAAPLFTALGDETRLRIVSRLSREGPLSISRLADGAPMSRQGISKHLRVLADAGLVRDQRRGRERIWRLRERKLDEAQRCLGAISAQWDAAIGRLQALVEDD